MKIRNERINDPLTGAGIISIHFDLSIDMPSTLTRRCLEKGMKRIVFVDSDGKNNIVSNEYFKETAKGVSMDVY